MPRFGPISRRDLIRTMQKAGFVGPFAGSRHEFMVRGDVKNQANIWCWPIGSGEFYGYRTDPKMSAEVKAGATP